MKILKALPLLALACTCVKAQELTDEQIYKAALDSMNQKPGYGVFGAFGTNSYKADFRALPGVPNCCPKFTTGQGVGPEFGVLAEFPVWSDYSINFRLGMSNDAANLTRSEEADILLGGKPAIGIFEHKMDLDFNSIFFEPTFGYKPLERMQVMAGMNIAAVIKSSFSQIERITQPADQGTFPDGLRYRNNYNGELPGMNSLLFGVTLGAKYSLPMNTTSSLRISPEAFFTYWVNSLVSGVSWNRYKIRGGLAITYINPPPPPPPPAPPIAPPMPELNLPAKPPVITATVRVAEIDSLNQEKQNFSVKIEDFTSYNMRPLLSYVFFDSASSVIPNRYKLLKPENAPKFNMKLLNNANALETYYDMLNIVGLRLKESTSSKIEIIGNNSNTGIEKNNKALSEERAISVRNYLRDTWGVEENRMKIIARNLPKEPTKSPDWGTDEENRRVEIVSTSADTFEPVFSADTIRKLTETNIRFFPKVTADAGNKNWKLAITQKGKILNEFQGEGVPPSTLDWKLSERDSTSPKSPDALEFTFYAEDNMGGKFKTQSATIPIERLTVDRKRLEARQDKEYEYYSLILFEYASSDLGKEHKKVVDFIKERVKSESNILVTGYTDLMGKDEVNKKISTNRAKSVAKRLKFKTADVIGAGKKEVLFDNKYPEGRFYCRTVKITIETPINETK